MVFVLFEEYISYRSGYVSPYFVINKGKFTKHYFEGAGRIVSKLGNGTFAQPLGITAGGVNYTQLTAEQQKSLDNYVKSLGVPPGPPTQQGIYATPEFTGDPYPSETLKPVEENQEPPEGWPRNPVFNAPGDVPGPPVQFGPPVEPTTVKAGEGFTGIGLPENDIFYFHPDHLGSTSYISAKNGSISQHVEYIAFGEVLFEEHSSSFSSPYLFNGKELDRETNLSYYGARYLDMKTSLWLSVDPLALYNPIFEEEFYFDGEHNGGIFYSGNLNPYIYCYQNPVRYIDPNGKQVEFDLLSNNWPKNFSGTDDKNNIEVFKSIWGKNYDEKTYFLGKAFIYNACATRGSIALGLSDIKIPEKYRDFTATEKGDMKGKPITTTATKMLKVMKELYLKKPKKIIKVDSPQSTEEIDLAFNGKKGMYIMIAKKGAGYTGHVGLYDGQTVLGGTGHYYVADAKEVYLFEAD